MDKKLRRAKRQLKKRNKTWIYTLKIVAFFKAKPKIKEVKDTRSNKTRVFEQRQLSGRLGKRR